MQVQPKTLEVQVDANWAGCKKTRKSTSGGSISWGGHCLKTWSNTQCNIAKSSAESELQGITRGPCEGLGASTLLHGLGMSCKVRIHVDANVAKSIVERQGLQKVRHIEVDRLWLQEQEARRILPWNKIPGTCSMADVMTNHVNEELMIRYMAGLGLHFEPGRAAMAAQVYHVRGSWNASGKDGRHVRRHVAWRRELFTPCGTMGEPSEYVVCD